MATVRAIERPIPDVAVLTLAVDADPPFRYREGQFIRVRLSEGRRRDLSIANAWAGDNRIGVFVRRAGGRFTQYVFGDLAPGDRWEFEGPLGDAWPRHPQRPLLLVAGGTGLGPARAIVEAALERDVPRRLALVLGAGEPGELFGQGELLAWRAAHDRFHYRPVVVTPDADWSGAVGTPETVIARDFAGLSEHEACVFGPPALVEATVPVLRRRGMHPGRIHADAFTPGATDLDRGLPGGR